MQYQPNEDLDIKVGLLLRLGEELILMTHLSPYKIPGLTGQERASQTGQARKAY